ncbi:FAD-dependent pyridine nucleotide-disulphide oxidoreductase [Beutenbergia cavernae DSM 12333]|uniref:FAD-dependent pyridine nucleotide-disulphide oxidoreductase n=1 Tax=Beutenbergia cavernae (strain ATCC BAA-8 / DSM 12333 / CCUG 43141 / JCM 11478 / NBRC 16432 / NCIMB 13614 / HKI 0122) TaxID=471853 RepID=C5C2J6_BEUC1|nr:NAD(P)/FAD-dependent oxidoreductase [Beutenbergia cavernae]ACQ79682.1 FAD-dependent pyridine nucleotide-disulphide oxidoreductase [Beutenbergia cavernae DSM 12333]
MSERDDVADVVVIGGGAAGLSAAVNLGRARRSVVVVDAGRPRNAPAEGVHAFLTRDGTPPAELLAAGRAEVERYGGRIVRAAVREAAGTVGDFTVSLDDGGRVRARRMLLATGVRDELPDVPGLRARWGRDVVHCPFCHGWEIADRRIGVVGSPMAVHQALLFRGWSDDVTLFLRDAIEPSEEEWAKLAARGIAVVDGALAAVEVTGDAVTGVVLADGTVRPVDALVVAPRVHADVVPGLGVAATEHPAGVGTYVATDQVGATSVPGVWAAGNLADPMAQVIQAAAAGTRAGAAIVADLLEEELREALSSARGLALSP